VADNLSNTCEGTQGTTVSNSNSTGPNQFTVVGLSGAGATCIYDNAQVHSGLTAIKNTLISGVSCTSNQNYSGAGISPTPVANAFMRFYIYITAYPTLATRIAGMIGSAATQAALQINVAGTIRILNNVGTQLAISTAAIPLNQWCRVEWDVTNITTSTADQAARIYSGGNLETNTPDSGGSISATGGATTALVSDVRFGHSSAVTMTANWSTWYDDVAFSDTAQPGPLVSVVGMVSSLVFPGLLGPHNKFNFIATPLGAQIAPIADQTISPFGIAASDSVGNLTVAQGSVTISPVGIASSERIGTAVIGPVITVTNDAAQAGQSNGTVVTTGNSGGGTNTAFSAIVDSPTFDNTHPWDSTQDYFLPAQTGTQCRLQLSTSAIAVVAVRAYAYFVGTLAPTSSVQWVQLGGNGANYVGVNTSAHPFVSLNSTVVYTSTYTLLANTQYRLEAWWNAAGSEFHYALYIGDDTASPVDTFDTLTATVNAISGVMILGKVSSTGNWCDQYINQIAIRTGIQGFIGPASGPLVISGPGLIASQLHPGKGPSNARFLQSKLGVEREDFLIVVADMQPGAGVNPPPSVVAAKVVADNPIMVLLPGDLANDGTTAQYGFFDTMYGAIKARLEPTPGNHDWVPGDLTQYDTYWGTQAHSPQHYYSFDSPTTGWHIIALDSDSQTAHDSSSAQYAWLQSDLAANTGKPIIAFWHHPRYSDGNTGSTGDDITVQTFWDLLYDAGCSIVFEGHCHSYQRFPKFERGTSSTTNPSIDSNGIKSFVVGTGGSGLHTGVPTRNESGSPNSLQTGAYDQLNSQWFGYLRLYLRPDSYRWEFVSQNAGILDSGGPIAINHTNLASSNINPYGLLSSEKIGNISVTTGAVTISPFGIVDGETVGNVTVSPGAVTISASGIKSSEIIGNATISSIATISPFGIKSSETIGNSSVQPGSVTINASGIVDTSSIGNVLVQLAQSINAFGIDSGQSVGNATATPGSVTVSPIGIASGEAVGALSVAQTLAPFGVRSSEVVGNISISVTAPSINPAGISSSDSVGNPSITAGSVTITAFGISSGEGFGNPSISVGASVVTPVGIISGERVGNVTVTTGSVTISPFGIKSGELVGIARVLLTQTITAFGIASQQQVGNVSIIVNVQFPSYITGNLEPVWVMGQIETKWDIGSTIPVWNIAAIENR